MVSFASEAIFNISTFPITNTLLHTFFVDLIIILLVFIIAKNRSLIPNKLQSISEIMLETFYGLIDSVAHGRTLRIFPYVVSFFLFIFIANLTNLLPGMGTVGFFRHEEFIPIFRGTTSDINTTLGLAIISAIATHMLSVKIVGIKDYLSRFFSLNPLNLFIGLLEIVSEITKVVSLSFRLFGNIFAGEVVLAKISSIFAFIIPLPFLMLEAIVGIVQALVFSMLTMAFMAILTTEHHSSNHKGVSNT